MGWVEGNRKIVGYMKTESCIGRGAIQSRHKAELGLLGLGGGEEENNQGQKKNELAKSTLERVEHCFWKGLMIQSIQVLGWGVGVGLGEFTSISISLFKAVSGCFDFSGSCGQKRFKHHRLLLQRS